jgi:hypothetical protein
MVAWIAYLICRIGFAGNSIRRRNLYHNPDTSGLDNSTYKFHYAALMKFESHYHLRFNEPLFFET